MPQGPDADCHRQHALPLQPPEGGPMAWLRASAHCVDQVVHLGLDRRRAIAATSAGVRGEGSPYCRAQSSPASAGNHRGLAPAPGVEVIHRLAVDVHQPRRLQRPRLISSRPGGSSYKRCRPPRGASRTASSAPICPSAPPPLRVTTITASPGFHLGQSKTRPLRPAHPSRPQDVHARAGEEPDRL